MLSQLAHQDFGSGPVYIYVQAATALVLLLAANRMNDFPRVMFLLARDRFAPRPFLRMGDRLAFNKGIALLSIVAVLVLVAFNGNTNSLIPLYAVGSSSPSPSPKPEWSSTGGACGPPRWRRSIMFNGVGCVLSAIVFLIAGITKFTAGACVSLLIIAGFSTMALLTRRHFDRVADAIVVSGVALPSEENEESPSQFSNLAIVPAPHLDRATMRALAYPVSLQQPVCLRCTSARPTKRPGGSASTGPLGEIMFRSRWWRLPIAESSRQRSRISRRFTHSGPSSR